MASSDFCPLCSEVYKYRCRCPRGDMVCHNGHEWHTCTVHGLIVIGPSNHETPTFFCTCPTKISDK